MSRPPDNDREAEGAQLLEEVIARVRGVTRETLDVQVGEAYLELKRLAHRALRYERDSATLNTTGLVNEAYAHLAAKDGLRWNDRRHFLAMAAVVMRHLVINRAKERLRLKRGGGAVHIPLEDAARGLRTEDAEELIRLDTLLDQLAGQSERAARVVECRFYAGLTVDETAEALGIAPATVKRDWLTAKGWLRRALGDAAPG